MATVSAKQIFTSCFPTMRYVSPTVLGISHAKYLSVIEKQPREIDNMKKTTIITGTVLILAAGTSLWADDVQTQTQTQTDTTVTYDQKPDDMYRASEISLGVFGMGTVGERTLDHFNQNNISRHGRLGAGADIEYFFNRYIGIEGEAWTENTGLHFVDDAGGNLVFRLPIGHTGLAPYAFGGGGHSFDPVSATYGDFGAGLEFRFCQHVGVFVDGRYVVPDRLGNYGLGRAGLRFSF
jgi:hypothetical protein